VGWLLASGSSTDPGEGPEVLIRFPPAESRANFQPGSAAKRVVYTLAAPLPVAPATLTMSEPPRRDGRCRCQPGPYRGGRSGAARPRSTRRRLCREPVVAAPRLFGRGRRDGRRGLPFRRRDRLCARIRWQPDPQIQQIIPAGHECCRLGAPKRSALPPTPASTRRSKPLSMTTSICRNSSSSGPAEADRWPRLSYALPTETSEPEAPRMNRRRFEFNADLGDRVPLHVAHDQFHRAEARSVSNRGCPA
jgi:hypothetical protein